MIEPTPASVPPAAPFETEVCPMSARRHRSIATLATATLIAGGSLGSSAHAAEPQPDPAPAFQAMGLFGGLLGGILETVVSATPAQVQEQLAPLTDAQTAALLEAADPAQLDSLLAVLTPTQLAGALGGGDLTSVVGGLSPEAITGLLGMTGGFGSVLSGLVGTAAGLGGGSPSPAAVTALVDQVTALLGGGLGGATPAQLGQLTSLLSALPGLVGDSGLDPGQLTGLLGTVTGLLNGAAAGTPAAAPLQQLLGALTGLGAGSPVGGPGVPAAATNGTGTTVPVGPVSVSAGAATGTESGEPFRAYRARAGSLRLSKTRRTASVLVKCPANAPVGCLVNLTSDVAGRRSSTKKAVAFLKGTQKRFKIRLTKAAAKRLSRRGGTVRVKARTVASTLASSTKSKKVRRRAR